MAYLGLDTVKPTKPIQRGNVHVFPKTTIDQIIVDESTDKRLPVTLSNPNLLINGDFQVWQRGESFTFNNTSPELQYTADRWRCMAYGGTISKPSYHGGIEFNSNQNKNVMMYLVEAWDKQILLNQDLTFSFMFNGVSYSHTFKLTSLSQALIINENFEFSVIDATSQAGQSANNLLLMFFNIHNGTLYWAKLEAGLIATAFSPRSYTEEMSECQMYYYVSNKTYGDIMTLSWLTNTKTTGRFYFPVRMRTTPTITVGGGQVSTQQGAVALQFTDQPDIEIVTNDFLSITAIHESSTVMSRYACLGFEADAEIY